NAMTSSPHQWFGMQRNQHLAHDRKRMAAPRNRPKRFSHGRLARKPTTAMMSPTRSKAKNPLTPTAPISARPQPRSAEAARFWKRDLRFIAMWEEAHGSRDIRSRTPCSAPAFSQSGSNSEWGRALPIFALRQWEASRSLNRKNL